MTLERTTKLAAVNSIISAGGDSAVTSLEGSRPASAIQGENILDETVKELQLTDWAFNTDLKLTLVRNVDNKIPITGNVVRVILNRFDDCNYFVAIRGDWLYDRNEASFVFTKDFTEVKVTYQLEWDELPEVARNYCKQRAARIYLDRTAPNNFQGGTSRQDEETALVILRRDEGLVGKHSMRDSLHAAGILNRSNNHGTY